MARPGTSKAGYKPSKVSVTPSSSSPSPSPSPSPSSEEETTNRANEPKVSKFVVATPSLSGKQGQAVSKRRQTSLEKARTLATRPPQEVVLLIGQVPVFGKTLCTLLDPDSLLKTAELDLFFRALNVVSKSDKARIVSTEAHSHVLAFKPTENKLPWLEALNIRKERKLIFPIVEAVAGYLNLSYIAINIQERCIEYYSSIKRNRQVLKLFEERYIDWIAAKWGNTAPPFDRNAWSPNIHVYEAVPSSDDAKEAMVIYCAAAEILLLGHIPTEENGLETSPNFVADYRGMIVEIVIRGGKIQKPPKPKPIRSQTKKETKKAAEQLKKAETRRPRGRTGRETTPIDGADEGADGDDEEYGDEEWTGIEH